MRRRLLPALAACVLLVLVACVGGASAATVTLMGRDGHARQINNPFLSGAALAPVAPPVVLPSLLAGLPAAPSSPAAAARAVADSGSHKRKRKKKPRITVVRRLAQMERTNAITTSAHDTYLHQWTQALGEERHLSAWRSEQLTDVTVLLHQLATEHKLTPGRLPVLFLTLKRNAQYWRDGPWLDYPDRVQFRGSELVWEYYPGYGLQLQINGTFGEADGFYEYGKRDWPKLARVIREMEPLAVHRGGGLAWEYYTGFDGGEPPWVSAMAEGTALEALSNAYTATKEHQYLAEAGKLLPIFRAAPPTGVGERTDRGWRYLQYSFSPSQYIINAFLQTLIGIDHYAKASGNHTAQMLFRQGSAEARYELPSYVVVGWSLYEPGELDPYSYHVLVTGFAQQLCALTSDKVYCRTYKDFKGDLTTSPAIHQLTGKTTAGRDFYLKFRLSQVADVGGVLAGPHGKDYLYTKAQFPSGVRGFSVPPLKRGSYNVTLTATDLAGNRTQIKGTLAACKKEKKTDKSVCPQ